MSFDGVNKIFGSMLISVGSIKRAKHDNPPIKGDRGGVSIHSDDMYTRHPSKSPLIRGDFCLP